MEAGDLDTSHLSGAAGGAAAGGGGGTVADSGDADTEDHKKRLAKRRDSDTDGEFAASQQRVKSTRVTAVFGKGFGRQGMTLQLFSKQQLTEEYCAYTPLLLRKELPAERASARKHKIPRSHESLGTTLFLDISGFTNLGEKLRKKLGAAEGAAALADSESGCMSSRIVWTPPPPVSHRQSAFAPPQPSHQRSLDFHGRVCVRVWRGRPQVCRRCADLSLRGRGCRRDLAPSKDMLCQAPRLFRRGTKSHGHWALADPDSRRHGRGLPEVHASWHGGDCSWKLVGCLVCSVQRVFAPDFKLTCARPACSWSLGESSRSRER